MKKEQIKALIDMNNDSIKELLSFNQFILNNEVYELLKENRELQDLCPHEYENGYCNYCYIKES